MQVLRNSKSELSSKGSTGNKDTGLQGEWVVGLIAGLPCDAHIFYTFKVQSSCSSVLPTQLAEKCPLEAFRSRARYRYAGRKHNCRQSRK